MTTNNDARQQERDQAWLDELNRADLWVATIERINRACRSDYGPERLKAALLVQETLRKIIEKRQVAACAD